MKRRVAAPDFVHAVGGDLQARSEDHPNPEFIDHVWITMETGSPDRLTVAVNTLSRRNRDAGFDPRVRLGILRGTWQHLPGRGVVRWQGFDYEEIEAGANLFFEHYERSALEELLLSTSARAILLEVWGAPYHHRRHPGIHQIHSRRASCAVPENIRNLDGALQFSFAEEQETALFLFKFCGQS